MNHSPARLALAAGLIISAASLTLAQTAPAPAPAAAPSPDDTALGGPKVSAPAATKTIVQREMDGKLVRLDTRPEQAALDLLSLTPQEKKAADEILTTRFTKVSALLAENQALFLKIVSARQSNDRAALIPLMKEFRPLALPFIDPPLVDQLAKVLPADKAAQLRAYVAEYMQAMIADEAEQGRAPNAPQGTDAAPDRPQLAPRRMEVNLLLREMGRALKSIVDDRKARAEELYTKIDATPEQRAQIEAIFRENTGKDPLNYSPTPARRAEMWEKIMALLTPEQKAKARELRRSN